MRCAVRSGLALAVLSVVVANGCGGSGNSYRDANEQQTLKRKCLTVDTNGECRVYAPSVVDLVVRPELYEGVAVQSSGVFSGAFEDRFLYASREDYEYGNQRAAVPLELTADQQARYRDRQGRRVQIEGRLKSGKLTNITSIQLQEFTRTDYSRMPPLAPPPPPK